MGSRPPGLASPAFLPPETQPACDLPLLFHIPKLLSPGRRHRPHCPGHECRRWEFAVWRGAILLAQSWDVARAQPGKTAGQQNANFLRPTQLPPWSTPRHIPPFQEPLSHKITIHSSVPKKKQTKRGQDWTETESRVKARTCSTCPGFKFGYLELHRQVCSKSDSNTMANE